MAQNSKIEWTDHTANLWWGCTKVHAGCDNCYAEHLSDIRYKNDLWGKDKPRKAIKSVWGNLYKFNAIAHDKGENHRVFVGSMMDIFEKPMPLINSKSEPMYGTTHDLRLKFFDFVESSPSLTFLLLTKRPSNINKYIPEKWKTLPPDNVWFGTSPVDQKTYDTLIPQLKKVNGNKFLSIEPQLDDIDLRPLNKDVSPIGIDWIIQGGESGPRKRPFNLDWAHSMRKQCQYYKIPYFFKQIDKVKPVPDDLLIRELPDFVGCR